MRAIEALDNEARQARPSETVILAANLLLKYVNAPVQWLDKAQPPEKE